ASAGRSRRSSTRPRSTTTRSSSRRAAAGSRSSSRRAISSRSRTPGSADCAAEPRAVQFRRPRTPSCPPKSHEWRSTACPDVDRGGRARSRSPSPPRLAQPWSPTPKPADQNIEKRVDRLLGQMTLEEKLEQIQLLADNQVTEADAKKGVGG